MLRWVSKGWFILLLLCSAVRAEDTQPRSLYALGFLSPVPSIVGTHLGIMTSEFSRARFSLGASSLKSSTLTLGLGADFLFSPQEEFSPVIGFQFSTRKLYKQEKIKDIVGQKYYFSLTTGIEIYNARTVLTIGLNWVIASPEETPVVAPYLSFGFMF